MRQIYINDRSLNEFGAKLATDYGITGYEITNAYHQGPDRSNLLLLRQTRAPLTITLPLDFYGADKVETMSNISAFTAQCRGLVEIDLSDGFSYTCLLDEIGGTSWLNDEICSVDVSFLGIRHGESLHFAGSTPLTILRTDTWPLNDCKITIKQLAVTSNTPVVITLSNEAGIYLDWRIDVSSGIFSGGDLVLDGIEKRNLYNGGNIPPGTMTWTDYPYLCPGRNTLQVSGGVTSAQLELDYTQTYL